MRYTDVSYAHVAQSPRGGCYPLNTVFRGAAWGVRYTAPPMATRKPAAKGTGTPAKGAGGIAHGRALHRRRVRDGGVSSAARQMEKAHEEATLKLTGAKVKKATADLLEASRGSAKKQRDFRKLAAKALADPKVPAGTAALAALGATIQSLTGPNAGNRLGKEADIITAQTHAQRYRELASDVHLMPLEYMMGVLHDPLSSKSDKKWAAAMAAPYMHRRMPLGIEGALPFGGAGGGGSVEVISPEKLKDLPDEDLDRLYHVLTKLQPRDPVTIEQAMMEQHGERVNDNSA